MNPIETNGLTKRFGKTTAADNISISVAQGQVFGFLGLNGAGKTTLIRMLLGMVRPDAGDIYLFGKKLTRHSNIWNNVGYLVETPYAYPNLTVQENLEVIFALRRLEKKSAITDIIAQLKLTRYAKAKAGTLSLGNQQRLGLAKALMHHPRLLILDEPINGLDPEGIVEVRNLLTALSQEGTTIFVSSHILEEVAKIADEVAIIHQSKMVTQLSASQLSQQLKRKLLLNTADNTMATHIIQSLGYTCTVNSDQVIEVTDEQAVAHPDLLATELVNNHLPPTLLSPYTEDLEHFFLRSINLQFSVI